MYIDHVGINTNDMEATLQFYCGILGMRLVRTMRTPEGRRHYNVEIGGGNAFAVFDGTELPTAGERQHVNHLALPVDTFEEFDAAYQRLKDHGVAVTENYRTGVWQDLLLPRSERHQVANWIEDQTGCGQLGRRSRPCPVRARIAAAGLGSSGEDPPPQPAAGKSSASGFAAAASVAAASRASVGAARAIAPGGRGSTPPRSH